jgi:pimeloyl-ACP methyl ester carboxylesterase
VQPKPSTRGWGGDRIAYQVLGDGPPDLVVTPGSFGHVDIIWEDPGMVLFFQTLASLSRLILFDRRGTGASDPLPLDSLPPWESHAHDLAAVLDEVGSQGAALLARLEAGPLALFSPAPGRSAPAGLILANTTAKYIAADYPVGVPPPRPRPSSARSISCWVARPWPPWACPAAPAMSGFCDGWRSSSAALPAAAARLPGWRARPPAPPRRTGGRHRCVRVDQETAARLVAPRPRVRWVRAPLHTLPRVLLAAGRERSTRERARLPLHEVTRS